MHLLLVGISHKTAPVELRERLISGARRRPALQSLAARGSRSGRPLDRNRRATSRDDVAATRTDLVSRQQFHAIDRPRGAAVYDVADLDAARHLFASRPV
jgi:hypothetical protein